MRGARADRADGLDPPPREIDANKAAARDGQRPRIQRPQQQPMTTEARRAHLRDAAPDRRAIGARSADLDEDAVGHALVQQGARDAGRRPREHGEDRAARDLAHVHDAAVAAHDRERDAYARARDDTRRQLGGPHHRRQDRRVQRRRPRTRAQAVRRRDLVPRGRERTAFAGVGDDRPLARRPVDAERVARDERLRAAREQGVDRPGPRARVVRRNEEAARGEGCPSAERRRRDGDRTTGEQARPPGDADDADARDVAFQQRVRRLRRRVRDERDARRVDGGIGEQTREAGDDARRDAVRGVVRRRRLYARDDTTGPFVDRHDVRERPADVDADPQTSGHSDGANGRTGTTTSTTPARAKRRRSGMRSPGRSGRRRSVSIRW